MVDRVVHTSYSPPPQLKKSRQLRRPQERTRCYHLLVGVQSYSRSIIFFGLVVAPYLGCDGPSTPTKSGVLIGAKRQIEPTSEPPSPIESMDEAKMKQENDELPSKCADATLSMDTIERLRELGDVIHGVDLVAQLINGANVTAQIYRLTEKFSSMPRMKQVFHAMVDHAKGELLKHLVFQIKPIRKAVDMWQTLPKKADALATAIHLHDDESIRRVSGEAADAMRVAKVVFTVLDWAIGRLKDHVSMGEGLSAALGEYKSAISDDILHLRAVAKCGLTNATAFDNDEERYDGAPDDHENDADEMPHLRVSDKDETDNDRVQLPPRTWEEMDEDEAAGPFLQPWMLQLSSKPSIEEARELHQALRRGLGTEGDRALIIREKRDHYYCNVVNLPWRPNDEELAAYKAILGQGGIRRLTTSWCACPELRSVFGTQVVYCHAPEEC